jgi:hypothetical protein
MMREFINIVSNLEESTGIAGRKPGDVFTSADTKETLTFDRIEFFPEGGGKLSPAELSDKVKSVESELSVAVVWENKQSPQSGGVAFIYFIKPDGYPVVAGRYLNSVKPNKTDNFIPNTVMGSFKLASKAAAKMSSGLLPQDILTSFTDLTSEDVVNAVAAKFGKDHALYDVALHLASDGDLPYTFNAPEDISFTAFRDYFCELLQPIALQHGTYTGNIDNAAEQFLDQPDFYDTLIDFDNGKNNGLYDSILKSENGAYVKISTKGGVGAQASVRNLVDSFNELDETGDGVALREQYSDIIALVDAIQAKGQVGSVIFLGKKFEIITDEDADKILTLRNQPAVDVAEVQSLELSANLLTIAKLKRPVSATVNMYYHLIACIAQMVADKINNETNFSDAAAAILNAGAVIQVYTKATEGKGKWTLQGFEAVYPGQSVAGVAISASKNYYSTGIKGNFTFKLLKQGEKADKDAEAPAVTPTAADTTVTAASLASRITKARSTTNTDVGRAKR